mmetsp:Transcript_10297/g.22488  ORF Transcript_10297/g.22488 Transcript_10297/m.22488 type:complete len:366 (-) Transcript_10297:549-1646(-)
MVSVSSSRNSGPECAANSSTHNSSCPCWRAEGARAHRASRYLSSSPCSVDSALVAVPTFTSTCSSIAPRQQKSPHGSATPPPAGASAHPSIHSSRSSGSSLCSTRTLSCPATEDALASAPPRTSIKAGLSSASPSSALNSRHTGAASASAGGSSASISRGKFFSLEGTTAAPSFSATPFMKRGSVPCPPCSASASSPTQKSQNWAGQESCVLMRWDANHLPNAAAAVMSSRGTSWKTAFAPSATTGVKRGCLRDNSSKRRNTEACRGGLSGLLSNVCNNNSTSEYEISSWEPGNSLPTARRCAESNSSEPSLVPSSPTTGSKNSSTSSRKLVARYRSSGGRQERALAWGEESASNMVRRGLSHCV